MKDTRPHHWLLPLWILLHDNLSGIYRSFLFYLLVGVASGVFSSPYSKHQSSVVCVINVLCFDISKHSMNHGFWKFFTSLRGNFNCFCIFFISDSFWVYIKMYDTTCTYADDQTISQIYQMRMELSSVMIN